MKFGKNMIIYASADLLGRSIGLITSPIATRLLTQEQYGVAPLLGAVWAVIALAQYAGMDWSYPFFLSKFSQDNTLKRQQVLVTATWGATIGAILVWGGFSIFAVITPILKSYARITNLELITYLISLFPGILLSWFLYLFRFLHLAIPFATVTLLGKVLGVTLAFPILAISPQKNRLFLMFFLSALVQILAIILGMRLFKKFEIDVYKFQFFSKDLCKQMLKYGLVLIPGGAVYSMSSVADRLLVGWLSSPAEVAILALAISLSSSILIIKGWFALVWDPHLVEWVATHNPNIYTPKLQTATIGLSSIFFPLACLADIWSDSFISLLYPVSYQPTETLVPYIVFTGAISVLSLIAVATTMIANNPAFHFPIYLTALAVNCGVGFILIPHLGAFGAVIGTLCAELSILLLWIIVGYFVLKNLYIKWHFSILTAIISVVFILLYTPGSIAPHFLMVEKLTLSLVILIFVIIILNRNPSISRWMKSIYTNSQ